MKRYVGVAGAVFVAYGVVQLGIAGMVGLGLLGLSGALMGAGLDQGDRQLFWYSGFYGGLGALAGVAATVAGGSKVVVGAGLRRRARWAWFGGLVCGALALSAFPVGTVFGVAVLAVLLDPGVRGEFGLDPQGG